ncbi:MAG: inositol monophosphatase [Gammaproteobacteria bacterium]|nr:MAG: inositol monophosphatase [Gammaproteobacteria bacterium]
MDIEDLREVEALLRVAAREELLSRFEHVEARTKADGSLVTDADLSMQARLREELSRRWPEVALLGEEMSRDQQTCLIPECEDHLWVLDPLDGTSNFASGIPFFGVSLALLAKGQLQAGIVLDPIRDESFSALRGRGAWLNGRSLRLHDEGRSLGQAMAMVDLKRLPPELILRLAREAPYHSQRSFGSVALDWCWLAAARVQVYLHGGQKLWDYAAGSLVLQEAGGVGGLFEDFREHPMEELGLRPRIAIAATHARLFTQWQDWIRATVADPLPAD